MNQGNIQATTCQTALDTFVAHDFRPWYGLPACSLQDITDRFSPVAAGTSLGRLGREQARFTTVWMPAYEEPVAVWFRSDQVVMLEVEYPEIEPDVPGLVQVLGEPEARLDFHWRSLLLKHSHLVYLKRGLALFVNPDNQILLRLAVFSPTTLSIYKRKLLLHTGEIKYGDGRI